LSDFAAQLAALPWAAGAPCAANAGRVGAMFLFAMPETQRFHIGNNRSGKMTGGTRWGAMVPWPQAITVFGI